MRSAAFLSVLKLSGISTVGTITAILLASTKFFRSQLGQYACKKSGEYSDTDPYVLPEHVKCMRRCNRSL